MPQKSAAATFLHAFSDALCSLGTYVVAYRIGVAFYHRLVSREHVKPHGAIQTLFALTFSVSVSLVCLILFDAIGLMHTATRRLNWLFDVYLLLILLVVVLPIAQVHHILNDLGISSSRSAKFAILAEFVFLYLFWRIGDPLTSPQHVTQLSRNPIFRTTPAAVAVHFAQAAMARILILGTTLLAILSGLTAVNLPYAYLGWFLHQVSEKDMLGLEKRLATSLQDIAAEKRYVLDTEPARDESAFGPRTIRHMPQSIVAAERRSHQLFEQYNDAATAVREIRFASTLIGRLFTVLGAVMLVLCGVRVFLALYNIVLRMRGTIRGYNGTPKLFVYLHAILQSFGVHVSGQVVYQYATLSFTSVLLATNLRAALKRMSSVFAVISGHESLSSSAPVFVAHLLGTYTISSTILIPFLPPGSRLLISDVMGDLEFQYFQSWFDVLFICSAAVAVCLLLYQQGLLWKSRKRARSEKARQPFHVRQSYGWSGVKVK